MKCERCNTKIEEGAIFCKKCGARINEKEKKIDIDVLKTKDKDDSDNFYQRGMEQNRTGIIIFLILIIVLLIGSIGYLLYTDHLDSILKCINQEVITINKPSSRVISFNGYDMELSGDIKSNYKDSKLFISNDNIDGVIYYVEDSYKEFVSNIEEIKLKWNEVGIDIVKNEEVSLNKYRIEANYKEGYKLFLLYKLTDKILVIETNFSNSDMCKANYNVLLNIINSVDKNNNKQKEYLYPEFNLDSIGAQ